MPLTNRDRALIDFHRFTNMTGEDVPARLTRVLDTLFGAINEDRFIEDIPHPKNLVATSKIGGVLLTWDAVDAQYIRSLYAARIWRVLLSDDDETVFRLNAKRRVLVPAILTTAYFDPTNDTDDYIYWVQWIDLLERYSDPSGSATAAGS